MKEHQEILSEQQDYQFKEGFILGKQEAKAQAISEFKEKLKEKFTEANNILYPAWKAKEIIEKTAQEMTG